jgi:hypothetical protein
MALLTTSELIRLAGALCRHPDGRRRPRLCGQRQLGRRSGRRRSGRRRSGRRCLCRWAGQKAQALADPSANCGIGQRQSGVRSANRKFGRREFRDLFQPGGRHTTRAAL